MSDVLAMVAQAFELPVAGVCGPGRVEPYPQARAVIAYVLRRYGLKWSEIGRAVHRHHSSVLAAERRARQALARAPKSRIALVARDVERRMGVGQ